MNKYVVNGMGRLAGAVMVEYLVPLAGQNGYKVITKPDRTAPARALFKQRKYAALAKELFSRQYREWMFRKKINAIRNTDVIVLHPQKVGYKRFFRLIENNAPVKLYVLDCGFFCIRSYNTDPVNNRECLKCLGNPDNSFAACRSSHGYGKQENIRYIKRLADYRHKIRFFAQTRRQVELLKKHFGQDIDVTVIGLNTGEISPDSRPQTKKSKRHIVYHGSLAEAKGFKYVLALSKYLKDYSILIPSSKEQAKQQHRSLDFDEFPNVQFREMRWNSGLKEQVKNASIVLCPSLWSAPVEGALLKSLAFNGNVAVYDTTFGFQKEIPQDILIRLDDDLVHSAKKIHTFIKNKGDHGEKARTWVQTWLENTRVAQIFKPATGNEQ